MKSGRYEAIVVGGGPGGLACAALLSKWGVRTLLLEKNQRTGGKAVTSERNGFRYELGPKLQVPMRDPAFAQLISALTGAPDPIGSTYQNLANSGYTIDLSSAFYLQEGDNATQRRIDVSEVLSFLRSLAGRNVQLRAGVVTQ